MTLRAAPHRSLYRLTRCGPRTSAGRCQRTASPAPSPHRASGSGPRASAGHRTRRSRPSRPPRPSAGRRRPLQMPRGTLARLPWHPTGARAQASQKPTFPIINRKSWSMRESRSAFLHLFHTCGRCCVYHLLFPCKSAIFLTETTPHAALLTTQRGAPTGLRLPRCLWKKGVRVGTMATIFRHAPSPCS
jgi:hypothetical protein